MGKSRRNRFAGNHPAYDKRNMDEEQIANKQRYDKKFNATRQRKRYRAVLNKANRDSGDYGNGDRLDKSHKKGGGMVNEAQSKNRARNGANGKSTKK